MRSGGLVFFGWSNWSCSAASPADLSSVGSFPHVRPANRRSGAAISALGRGRGRGRPRPAAGAAALCQRQRCLRSVGLWYRRPPSFCVRPTVSVGTTFGGSVRRLQRRLSLLWTLRVSILALVRRRRRRRLCAKFFFEGCEHGVFLHLCPRDPGYSPPPKSHSCCLRVERPEGSMNSSWAEKKIPRQLHSHILVGKVSSLPCHLQGQK